MERVIFYIDGFNFYYGLKAKGWKKYYWLDFVKFFEQFTRESETLVNVLYFTATPIDPGKKDRQDLLFSANKLNPKFKLIFGKYLRKEINIQGHRCITFEEKQTDVNIAVNMIKNVLYKNCDKSILVSADSDLLPALDLMREIDPSHKINCLFPPLRHSIDLENHSDYSLKLIRYEHRFKKSLLPGKVTLPSNYVILKPDRWR
jgi:uncharacterized LabA/DUF88 family protein